MRIFSEPVYDLDELARYNLHVHTTFSGCAKKEMTVASIVKAAEDASLAMIALTDHGPDFDENGQFLRQKAQLQREFEETGSKLKVLFGSEISGYGIGQWDVNDENLAQMEYRLVANNHFHVHFSVQPEDTSPRGFALFAMDLVRKTLESGRFDCVAHPLHAGYVRSFREDCTVMTKAMTDNELGELCEIAARTGTALEINTYAVETDPVFLRRLWNLGREAGATFHYGTDAHQLHVIDTKTLLPAVKKALL